MSPSELTETTLAAIFEVSNTLGPGFLEKVYARALQKELTLRNLKATPQASFPVTYKGNQVGEYFADLLVENELVIELKCVDRLGLLVNFQRPRVQWKRIVLGPGLSLSASV